MCGMRGEHLGDAKCGEEGKRLGDAKMWDLNDQL